MRLRNGGSLPVEWRLRTPTHYQVAAEKWVEEPPPTPHQALQRTILDKGLFEINPLVGSCASEHPRRAKRRCGRARNGG